MKSLYLTISLIIGLIFNVLGQSSNDENENRAMYNQIEYLFNANQLDSIYSLASPSFQKQITASQLKSVLTNMRELGQIREASLIKYGNGAADYKVSLDSEVILMVLRLEDSRHFNELLFQPYTSVDESTETELGEEITTESLPDAEQIDDLELAIASIAKDYLRQPSAQSLSIGIIDKGNIKKYFYGALSKGNPTAPSEETLYEIGSVTKTFTATLLAELAEQGAVSLDDPITKFLPDSLASNEYLQKITLTMLANHTSGLPRLPGNWNEVPGFSANDPYAAYDRKHLFSFLKNFNSENTPGEQYEYSNLGYGLLGEIISIVSKKTYEACINDVILTPLFMNNTKFSMGNSGGNEALPHHEGNAVPSWNFKAMAGAGSIKSDVNDLLRYAITQLSMPQTALQKAMMTTKMFTFFIPPVTDIGLAWHMDIIEDITCIWHNGQTGGSAAFIGLLPDENSAVVVLSNADVKVDKTAHQIIKHLINQK